MYPAVASQSQSFQCHTPNPNMSWSFRNVRQSWLLKSFGSPLIQSYLKEIMYETKILNKDDLPFNLLVIVVPGPVAPLVFTVISLALCSNPPLFVPSSHFGFYYILFN